MVPAVDILYALIDPRISSIVGAQPLTTPDQARKLAERGCAQLAAEAEEEYESLSLWRLRAAHPARYLTLGALRSCHSGVALAAGAGDL
jgi:hypothetical protein